ncbi:radical SAM protein [Labrys miyagiensis]|nr:radical SAM protein [Labrys miyagiensis]
MRDSISSQFYLSIFSNALSVFKRMEDLCSNNPGSFFESVRDVLHRRSPSEGLSSEDMASLLCLVRNKPDPDLRNKVIRAARDQRRRTFGQSVATMVPIEVTSFCSSTCRFCGWRADNKDMVRLSITEAAIREQARILARKGFSHFEIAGGDDLVLLQEHLKGLVRGLKEETSAVNPDARVSICLVPMHEHHYRELRDEGLDCVLTWQETYDGDLYRHHIPSGPKAWGVDENLRLKKKTDEPAGFLHRMQSQELAIRAGLQAGLGAMLGLSRVTEADILSVVMHGQKLIEHYEDRVEPLIIGMPAWNPILTPETDNRNASEFDFDAQGNFELISAIYLLAFPDRMAWVFANGRVPPEIQTNCVDTACCFTSTLVQIAPGAYLDFEEAKLDAMFARVRGVSGSRPTFDEVMSGEQFMHYFASHEEFVAGFAARELHVVPDRSYLRRMHQPIAAE